MDKIVLAVLFIAFLALWLLLLSWIIMLAWNAFVPSVLGGVVITHGQALAGWVIVLFTGGTFRTFVSKSDK